MAAARAPPALQSAEQACQADAEAFEFRLAGAAPEFWAAMEETLCAASAQVKNRQKTIPGVGALCAALAQAVS